jgi:hypothetical protein
MNTPYISIKAQDSPAPQDRCLAFFSREYSAGVDEVGGIGMPCRLTG